MNQLRTGLMKPTSLSGGLADTTTSNLNSYQASKSINPPTLHQQSSSNKKTKNMGSLDQIGKGNGSSGSQGGNRSKLPPAAQEALSKAGNNPGNQIRISRNAQGGVDFTPIPASQVAAK